jgi:hypothetical protein
VKHGIDIYSHLRNGHTHCLFHRGIEAVTVELLVRYLRPVPIEAELELRARITAELPMYRWAELRHAGQLMAYGRAKFARRTLVSTLP